MKESSNSGCCDFSCWQKANMVVVQHGDSEYSWYVHLAYSSVPVSVGDVIGFGTKVGTEDSTGYACGVHLHYMASTGHTSWTDPNDPNKAPWATGITAVDFAEVSWAGLTVGQGYISQNGGGSDTTDPDGDITSPSEGATISSRTVHLAGWAQDNAGGSGFNHAHFTAYYNGSWRQVGPDFTSSPFGFDWDMCDAGVPDGPVTIGLDIWDNAGNEANSPHGVRHFTKNYNCSPPPSCNPNADQVALYANTGYGGSCVTLGVGDYPNPGYLGSLGNDNAESIKVGSNVQAILYEHDNYQGRSETFTGDDSNLGDNYIGANVVSSVKVQWRAQPPAAPTLQSPANGTTFNEGQGINLSWSATGNEYYGEAWGGPGGTLTFGWQSGTSKDIGSQWAGYTYSWHVKARNGAGESGWSSTWTFTVKPAAPSNLSAQTASCNQVNLYWTDNSGNEEGYKVYRNGSYVGQVGMNSTNYQDTGLSENTTYSYYVKAFRGSIESDVSNTVNITTPPCAPPQPDLRPYAPSGYPYPV
ncbi:MAG: peptidoglycan DD-metalloendopeptidase family protein, partial [Anaerolineae bacterium]